jgi:hypothetical protein
VGDPTHSATNPPALVTPASATNASPFLNNFNCYCNISVRSDDRSDDIHKSVNVLVVEIQSTKRGIQLLQMDFAKLDWLTIEY